MPMQGFAYNSIFLERSIDTDLMCYIGKKNKKKVTSLKNILIFAASIVIKRCSLNAEIIHIQQDIIKQQLSINQEKT